MHNAGNAEGQLRHIKIKNHINPPQSLIAPSMDMLMVIDPEKNMENINWISLVKIVDLKKTKNKNNVQCTMTIISNYTWLFHFRHFEYKSTMMTQLNHK